jgi:hypothetical protein
VRMMGTIESRIARTRSAENELLGKVKIARTAVAQEAYGPLGVAQAIVDYLEIAVWTATLKGSRGYNNFENTNFVQKLRSLTENFSKVTEDIQGRDPRNSMRVFFDLYNGIDDDISKENYFEAMRKVVKVSIELMDRVRGSMKHKYPW